MSNLEIANTIKNQLGAKCLFMLGAKNLAGGSNFLSFRIRGSKLANYVKITLNISDLYEVEFGKIRGTDYKEVASVCGVYATELHEIIEAKTGLDTSIGFIKLQ